MGTEYHKDGVKLYANNLKEALLQKLISHDPEVTKEISNSPRKPKTSQRGVTSAKVAKVEILNEGTSDD